jgi:serine/threonine-protein kinase
VKPVSVESGSLLVHYRLIEKIGEGGMGVVWRALDTTLDREVAIKILPEAFAEQTDRLARFEREAKLLASLNHPNVATIHGLHEHEGLRFLAMELVPGEDLASRLSRGPVVLEEALAFAGQIADALEAAHASGVVHRDLKPSNIRITPDGKVRVLDFGLAKAGEAPRTQAETDPSLSPTVTSVGSVAGVILGTAAYMSPEQARGAPVDRRADTWAFGCVLYEMLAGRGAFKGETTSDTLAAVLRADPDWNALPARTPPSIRRLLRRCLEKRPERRLHSAADARLEIDDAASEPIEPVSGETGKAVGRRTWVPWLVALACAIVAAVALGVVWKRSATTSREQLHVAVTLPQQLELHAAFAGGLIAALSPDGSRLAFVAREEDTIRLYLRSLDSPEIVAVPETESAWAPFFSPDGQWLAFFAKGKLKKVSVQGGTPVELCDAPSARGASWAPDGTIVISPIFTTGLARIPDAGGELEVLTVPDRTRNERTHRWPDVLPGGNAAIFTIGTLDRPGYYEDATIAVVDFASGRTRTLIEGGSIARYSPTGHLIYSREGSLLAVPFDADRLEVTGPPAPLLEGVARETTSGAVHFAVSRDGTLMYVPAGAPSPESTMVWVDREGRAETIMRTPAQYLAPRLSPDGTKLAVGVGPGLGDGDIWIHDLQHGKSTRLTFESDYVAPIWTPDGKRVVFGVTRGGSEGVAWKAADGSDAEQMILRHSAEFVAEPASWVPGTDTIIYSTVGGSGGYQIMATTLGEPEPRSLVDGPGWDGGVSTSPDGRWMAYASDESGQFEVYVRPYPGPGGKWQLSTEGGKGPIWSRDGREIFYTDGYKMMVVPVETEPTFSPGTPRKLFEYGFIRAVGPTPDYDVAPDGKRFLMFHRSHDDPPRREINVVTNLAATLKE